MEKKFETYIDAWYAGVALKAKMEKQGVKNIFLYSNRPSKEVVAQKGAKEDSFIFDDGNEIIRVFKYNKVC